MKKYVEATIRFEVCEDEEVSHADLGSLHHWLEGTLDNAPMDEEVGFPDSLESYGLVVGVNIVTDRPRA